MNCEQTKELFGAYWDADKDDPVRKQVDAHVEHCVSCSEELRIWEESKDIIQSVSFKRPASVPQKTKLSTLVMDRIYQEESWRIPIAKRAYHFTVKFQRNMIACMAFLLALFVVSFLVAAIHQSIPSQDISGLSAPFTASNSESNADHSSGSSISFKQINVLTASISDPPVLRIDVVPSSPNYYLALSLLGMVSILLIMNWLSRIR